MELLFEEYEPIKNTLIIGDLLTRIKKPEKKEKTNRGITNERQSIIKQFVDEINQERTQEKMKPLTSRYIAIKLGILKSNDELYQFLSECKDYKKRNGSFGKRFFGGFKEKINN
jgi:hypothetical protein